MFMTASGLSHSTPPYFKTTVVEDGDSYGRFVW